MAKQERPEWFKFWRRNRRTLDIDQLSMESRGRIFTNMMRYFDSGENELIELDPLESAMFNVLKINVDDSFSEFAAKSEQNRKNVMSRWDKHQSDNTAVYDGNDRIRIVQKTEDRGQKTEDRGQSTEDRGQSTEVETKAAKPQRKTRFVPPSLTEVEEYCQARGNHVDPKRFFDYYSSSNWRDRDGKPVQSWKQRIISWEVRNGGEAEKQGKAPDFSWRAQNGGNHDF